MRGEDYYSEGMLIWLEVDARLRQLSGGRRSMNDFARAFFGVHPGDQGVATYDFDDVVATLNGIAQFDWAAYLHERVDRVRPRAPLDWIAAGGYRLVYRNAPSATAAVLHDGWYDSGDYGFQMTGELFVIGRKKDIIILAGKNIYPEDVEAVVAEVDGVIPGRVVAFGREDEATGTECVCVVAETEVTGSEARRAMRRAIQ